MPPEWGCRELPKTPSFLSLRKNQTDNVPECSGTFFNSYDTGYRRTSLRRGSPGEESRQLRPRGRQQSQTPANIPCRADRRRVPLFPWRPDWRTDHSLSTEQRVMSHHVLAKPGHRDDSNPGGFSPLQPPLCSLPTVSARRYLAPDFCRERRVPRHLRQGAKGQSASECFVSACPQMHMCASTFSYMCSHLYGVQQR